MPEEPRTILDTDGNEVETRCPYAIDGDGTPSGIVVAGHVGHTYVNFYILIRECEVGDRVIVHRNNHHKGKWYDKYSPFKKDVYFERHMKECDVEITRVDWMHPVTAVDITIAALKVAGASENEPASVESVMDGMRAMADPSYAHILAALQRKRAREGN